jgi:SH3-like domain-containing protein
MGAAARRVHEMTRTPVFVFAFILAASAASADPAVTTVAAGMRGAPTAKARLVQSVPANAEIDLNYCSKAWCYASWRDRFGYLPASAVAAPPYPDQPDGGPPPIAGSGWGGGWGPFYYGSWYRHW